MSQYLVPSKYTDDPTQIGSEALRLYNKTGSVLQFTFDNRYIEHITVYDQDTGDNWVFSNIPVIKSKLASNINDAFLLKLGTMIIIASS